MVEVSAMASENFRYLMAVAGLLIAGLAVAACVCLARRVRLSPNRKILRHWMLLGGLSSGYGVWAAYLIWMLCLGAMVPIQIEFAVLVAALVVAIGFSSVAVRYVARLEGNNARMGAAVSLVAGFLAVHFIIRMGAEFPTPLAAALLGILSADWLAGFIFLSALFVVGQSLIAALASLHRNAYEVSENDRLRVYIDALLEREARFSDIMRNLGEGVIVTADDGMIVLINPSAETMAGVELDDLIGTNISAVIHPEDREKLSERMRRVYAAEEIPPSIVSDDETSGAFELRVRRIDNTIVTCSGIVSRMSWAGHIRLIVGLRDITHRKRMQDELRQHRDHLAHLVAERTATIEAQAQKLEESLIAERALNEMQRNFIAMASHEFRTPLTIIDGQARRIGLRADSINPDEVRDRTSQIRATVKRLSVLIERTLDVSRMSAGRVDLKVEDCPLREMVHDTIKRLGELAVSHTFSVDIQELPETILADPRLMEQVLSNIIGNATKYSVNDPRIEVHGIAMDGYAILRVKDFGLGIARDELGRIFEQYFRARTSQGITGTGIGLHLVKSLVEMHHGTIEIASEEGRWTELTVRLPVFDEALRDQGDAACGPEQDEEEAA